MNLEQVYISAVSFLAVVVMLTILAGLMSILTRVFPGRPLERKPPRQKTRGVGGTPEAEIVAAVTAAVTAAFPGTRVTKIEEVK